MSRVIVFDVNETLLDLGALDPHFKRAFADAGARREWFAQVLQSAMVATIIEAYSDFSAIGSASLDMIAARRGVSLSDDDREMILESIRTLPPHPDVRRNLERLSSAGLRLATLTNNPPQVVKRQLESADLDQYVERILSVDAVRLFKPAPAVYQMAAQQLGVECSGVRLVAAHDWDIAGAMRAGCAAAFITRPGMVLSPLLETPDIVGPDLDSVAEQILNIELSH